MSFLQNALKNLSFKSQKPLRFLRTEDSLIFFSQSFPQFKTILCSSLTDDEKKRSEGPLYSSSCCCCLSLTILHHSPTSLSYLSFSSRLSFSIHRPCSGPLQPLCAFSVPLSSLHLPVSSGERDLPS